MTTARYIAAILNLPTTVDPNIGRKWNSRRGEVEIVGERGDTYLTKYGDTIYFEPKSTIERTILIDEDGYRSMLKQKEQELEQSRKEEEKKIERYEDYGFTSGMTGVKKERIIEALNKIVSWNSVVKPRKQQIVDAIKSGSTVKTMKLGGKPTRVLIDQDNAFFDEPVVTKIGMDFAEYLISSGVLK